MNIGGVRGTRIRPRPRSIERPETRQTSRYIWDHLRVLGLQPAANGHCVGIIQCIVVGGCGPPSQYTGYFEGLIGLSRIRILKQRLWFSVPARTLMCACPSRRHVRLYACNSEADGFGFSLRSIGERIAAGVVVALIFCGT